MSRRKRLRIWAALVLILAVVSLLITQRYRWLIKREHALPEAHGTLVRGGWQRPGPMNRLVQTHGIRTIVTLTAINPEDPKHVWQQGVVDRHQLDWFIIPMRGSTATLDQLDEAADLLDDPSRRPLYFHCVAGHHRSNLVQAAFRMKHQGWSLDRAWNELVELPWTRPGQPSDQRDRVLLERFARRLAASGSDPDRTEDRPDTPMAAEPSTRPAPETERSS